VKFLSKSTISLISERLKLQLKELYIVSGVARWERIIEVFIIDIEKFVLELLESTRFDRISN